MVGEFEVSKVKLSLVSHSLPAARGSRYRTLSYLSVPCLSALCHASCKDDNGLSSELYASPN